MRSFIGAQTRSKRKSLWLDNLNISLEKLMTLISLSFSGLIYMIQSQRFFGEGLNAKTSLPLEKLIKIF